MCAQTGVLCVMFTLEQMGFRDVVVINGGWDGETCEGQRHPTMGFFKPPPKPEQSNRSAVVWAARIRWLGLEGRGTRLRALSRRKGQVLTRDRMLEWRAGGRIEEITLNFRTADANDIEGAKDGT